MLSELSASQLRAVDGEPARASIAGVGRHRTAVGAGQTAARDLAAALAVINQRSPLPMVARVAGVEAPVEPFETLLGTGFVRWDPGEPGPPVEFAHPLYRQAVYQDLSPTRRRDLHRAVAGALTPAYRAGPPGGRGGRGRRRPGRRAGSGRPTRTEPAARPG